MKRLTFLFAMVFCASMAFAQTATVNQTNSGAAGSTQSANVSQTGVSAVTVTQISSKVTHPDGLNPEVFSQTAKVKQSGGDGNVVTVYQLAEGRINGGTALNTTDATQKGTSNVLKQTQISADYTSGGMDFIAVQDGTGNIGEQYSKKTQADFTMDQKGQGNYALQTTTGEKTGILTAVIMQNGEINQARQIFHGTNVRWAGASIDQKGVNNKAKQEFDNSNPVSWNDPSKADIIQTNQDNVAYQNQDGQGSYQYIKQTGVGNTANMWSEGNFNKAHAMQEGASGVINIKQKQSVLVAADLSEGNVAFVSQKGLASNANIMQDGQMNAVEGLGGAGTYAINDNGAQLVVNQNGTMNVVQSKQTVAGLETVTQTGMNNTTTVVQY